MPEHKGAKLARWKRFSWILDQIAHWRLSWPEYSLTAPLACSAWTVKHAPPLGFPSEVLFVLDDGKDLLGSLFILLLLGGVQMVVKMLPTVIFPVLPEIIAFANASLQAEVYLLNG